MAGLSTCCSSGAKTWSAKYVTAVLTVSTSNKGKTFETISVDAPFFSTGLKPGVNEKDF
jgi:hypothetical protein